MQWTATRVSNYSQTYITDLEFAEDLILLWEDVATFKSALDEVNEHALNIGLEIINTIRNREIYYTRWSCKSDPTSKWPDSNCLRFLLSLLHHPTKRTSRGWCRGAHWRSQNSVNTTTQRCQQNEVAFKTKLWVFDAAIQSVLLCGCETWPLRTEDIRILEVLITGALDLFLKKAGTTEFQKTIWNRWQIGLLAGRMQLRRL